MRPGKLGGRASARPDPDATAMTPSPTAAAVLVAAGSSTRMGASSVRKPFLELEGRTVLQHTCAAFDAAPSVVELVIVTHADDLERVQRLAAEAPELAKSRAEIVGGAERADSVRMGTLATSFSVDVVLVHDAARPLVPPEVVERAVAVAAERGAALVAVPVHDTIKASRTGEFADETVDRSRLWRAQTPQAFRARELRRLVLRAQREGFRPTDESALWERYVGPVPLVPGDPSNLKITTVQDLALARALLESRAAGAPAGAAGEER